MSNVTKQSDHDDGEKPTRIMDYAGSNSGKGRGQPSMARTDGPPENLNWVRKDNIVGSDRRTSGPMARGGSSNHLDRKQSSSNHSFQHKYRCGIVNDNRWVTKDNFPSTRNANSSQTSPLGDSFQQISPGIKYLSSGIANPRVMPNSPQTVDYSPQQVKHVSTSGSKFHGSSHFSAQSGVVNEHVSAAKIPLVEESVMATEICINSKALSSTVDKPNQCVENTKSGMEHGSSDSGKQSGYIFHEKAGNSGRSENVNQVSVAGSFDICQKKAGNVVKLKAPLHVQNREKRALIKHSMEGKKIVVLRPGMVLLKSYISSEDQIRIVKRCRECGIGKGGFYEPGYRDGSKLHLKMMCLGMNWDPDTGKYDKVRPVDGANAPDIPNEFHEIVKSAMLEAHAHLQKQGISGNMFPLMTPNICIVNYYSTVGRLGLHQDKDESPSSLKRGLPVVSFSIGDSAEFLYGDKYDVEEADKVVLKSGDVLIFGGKSRHVFHGVASINPNTAPSYLLEATDLRPGRLNLTFREY